MAPEYLTKPPHAKPTTPPQHKGNNRNCYPDIASDDNKVELLFVGEIGSFEGVTPKPLTESL